MNNLSRRVFLRSAGIISIAPLSTNHAFAQNQTIKKPLSQNGSLLAKISKKTYSLETLSLNNLLNVYKLSLNDWQKNGYEAFGANFYICQDENLALFPLQYNHTILGLIDSMVLCFRKNQEDEWISIKSLSGFDLEVLTVAAEGLQKYNPDIDLGSYLLPSFPLNNTNSFCFNTPKGEVFIKTFLFENNAKTGIIVKEGDRILFQQTIISEHHFFV